MAVVPPRYYAAHSPNSDPRRIADPGAALLPVRLLMNLVVLQGVLRDAVQTRTLSNGQVAYSFDVGVPGPEGAVEAVPVVCLEFDPRPSVGQEVVVIGRVRKRFFRAGAATQARTEVVARRVVATRKKVAAGRALSEARGEFPAD